MKNITLLLLVFVFIVFTGCAQQLDGNDQTNVDNPPSVKETVKDMPSIPSEDYGAEDNTQDNTDGNIQSADSIPSEDSNLADNAQIRDNTILITSTGFDPETLSVGVGSAVTFVNKDTSSHWPASVVHPTHTAYPGSGISKCGTPEESNIFDACRELGQEETFIFIFNEEGSWNYHDHLRPGRTGKIIVE